MSTNKTQLQYALQYARYGLQVLPLYGIHDGHCACKDGKECNRPGKHPRTKNGVHDATTDSSQIKKWWGKWPNANIGIAAGKVSDIIVIDIDPRHNGTKTLKILEAKFGPLPSTMTSHTGGGGEHRYFKYPSFDVKSDTAGKVFGPGVDLISDGSIVVAPKSRHVSGQHYSWSKGPDPLTLPQRWADHLKASTARADAPTATPGPIRPIALDEIRIDECVQARAKIVPKVVDEYTEAMLKGDEFPPLVVFQEGGTNILADGFTRLAAAKRAGRANINCEVRPGGLRDAMLFAAGANTTHGCPRSTADKRCAVLKLLNDDEWGSWADREIARHCHVGHQLVAELREVTGRATSERKFRSKHGSVGKMKVGKIGQKSRRKSSSAASSRPEETQRSALLPSTADTNETQTTPGTPTSAPAASPNIRTKPDGDGLEIPDFLDRRDPAQRTFAGLKAEWQNAAAFRHACAAAPVAVRDKFYAEVMQNYRE